MAESLGRGFSPLASLHSSKTVGERIILVIEKVGQLSSHLLIDLCDPLVVVRRKLVALSSHKPFVLIGALRNMLILTSF